jgi:hypothetical protein
LTARLPFMASHVAEMSANEKMSMEHHESMKGETTHAAAERGYAATDMYAIIPSTLRR